jgi:hypothetical protein
MSDLSDKDQLSRELHERSHDIGGHPIGLDSVKQSARKIQRRRRVVGGAVAAAVLAVAVPAGLAVTNGINQTSPGPVAPGPSVTKTATPRPDGPVTLTMQGLPRGEKPGVAYFEGGSNKELVTPDGTKSLPVGMQGLTPYDGGWIGLGYDGRGEEMFLLDADLEVTDHFSSGQRFAVSSDGSQVAYVRIEDDDSQTLVNAPTDGTDPVTWSFAQRPPISPVGFVDADTVLYQTEEQHQQIGLATVGGETEQLDGFVKVTGASTANGLVAGQTRSNPDGSGCFGVMDPAASTSEMVWETCDYSVGSFSPDGQLVLGGDAYGDGIGARSVSVLDAQTGDLVVTYQQDRDSQIMMPQVVWEDSDSVLATAVEGQDWTLLRLTSGGEVEAATDPVKADPYADFYYVFATPG